MEAPDRVDRARDLLAIAAHELNNELQVLVARLDLLEQRACCTDAARTMQHDVSRLRRLVRDYLTFGQLQHRPLCLDVAPLPVGSLLADVCDNAELSLGLRPGIEGDTRAVVLADQDRLNQAVWNLVRNAFRHGGAPVTLTVTSLPGHVLLGVGDCGGGFVEDAPEIRMGGGSSVSNGSGIGLWLANEIVLAHGGRLWLGRSVCGGAHVGVLLPAQA